MKALLFTFLFSSFVHAEVQMPYHCQQAVKLMSFSFPVDFEKREIFVQNGEGFSQDEARASLDEKIGIAEQACKRKSQSVKFSWCTKTQISCSQYFPTDNPHDEFGSKI